MRLLSFVQLTEKSLRKQSEILTSISFLVKKGSVRIRSQRGFSLIETMIVAVIVAMIMAGGFVVMASGQSAWFTTDATIQLEENLRMAISRLTRELAESGADLTGNLQVFISNGTGLNGSDIIKFSIPVICNSATLVMDGDGNVAYWGAPLKWGCYGSTYQGSVCMDADNNCTTLEYKFIEYRLISNNQLARRVLDATNALVREDIFAKNITDFQTTLSGDENVVTIDVSGQNTSVLNRIISASKSVNVRLRNKT